VTVRRVKTALLSFLELRDSGGVSVLVKFSQLCSKRLWKLSTGEDFTQRIEIVFADGF
jgi:hypothetical protein